jgi:hypothetical protein
MSLKVEDFGGRAVGRHLTNVSIAAGSNVLAAEDGVFRTSDVGKLIALPGAVDLVTSLADFPKPKLDIDNAQMQAGSDILTALGAGFATRVHTGMRITVQGAGPDGNTLLSDVMTVIDDGTVRVADAAATTVVNTVAQLNVPDRVRMADYPRVAVGPLDLEVHGRPLPKATLTIGDPLLRCATGLFSSLDLGEQMTVPGAGCLVTTILGISSDKSATLGAASNYTIEQGIAEAWSADSDGTIGSDTRPAFDDLLAALQTSEVVSGEIEFGAGVYDFTRPAGTSGLPAAIALEGVSNLTLCGAGRGVTILRMMPGQDLSQGDASLLMVRDCHHLTIRDLTLYGAYLTMGASGEPMHGIHLNTGCLDVTVEQVDVEQCGGDGVRLVGDPLTVERSVRQVSVRNCRLVQNHRTGIAFQRAVALVWVRDCFIDMTPPGRLACIDFEPTAPETGPLAAPADVFLDSNVLRHGTEAVAVSISGVRATDPTSRVWFTNNTLHGGGIGGVHNRDVTIAGNVIVAGPDGQIAAFRGRLDGLRILDNTIYADAGSRVGLQLSPQGEGPRSVRILGNRIETAGIGMVVDGPEGDIEVRDNQIVGRGESAGISIVLRSPGGGLRLHRGIRVIGNTIGNFADAGIDISTMTTAARFDGLEVSNNELFLSADLIPDHQVGIRWAEPHDGTDRWADYALITQNRISEPIAVKIDRPATVPFIATSGNPSGPATYEGDGDPSELGVAAPPGSLFIDLTNPTGAALHLKVMGKDATGWTQVALNS